MNRSLSIIILSLFLFSCSTTGEGYMQQEQLLAKIKKGQPPVIIDVRSDSEYKSSHVPGAIHIPFWTAFTTDKLDSYDKTESIVLYCEHGPRAGISKLAMRIAGFENISYLAGHMTAWKKAGLPVERDKEESGL